MTATVLVSSQRNAQRPLAARRSSIKSRSTSQYLSDDNRSLSISSDSVISSSGTTCGRHASKGLVDLCGLRLNFDFRDLVFVCCTSPIESPLFILFSG